MAGRSESRGGARLEAPRADATWTAGRWATVAWGGQAMVEAALGDARRWASAGMGDESRGPGAAPSRAERAPRSRASVARG
jgi:hypothetical protein